MNASSSIKAAWPDRGGRRWFGAANQSNLMLALHPRKRVINLFLGNATERHVRKCRKADAEIA